jgi:predicted nucleotidyltransferase
MQSPLNAEVQINVAISEARIATALFATPNGDIKRGIRLIQSAFQRLDELEKRIQPHEYFKDVLAYLRRLQSQLPKDP